jgi:hypothetical protein
MSGRRVRVATVPGQTQRWGAEQVLALAPDVASQRVARVLAAPSRWREAGRGPAPGRSEDDPPVLWGLCRGGAGTAYQTIADLAEPAYHCSCPSRKVPCKHALALMLVWSGGFVPAAEAPEWVTGWLAGQQERRRRTAARAARGPAGAGGPDLPPSKAAQRRAERVDGGVEELDRWLSDQVRQGLAAATRAGYAHWDAMAARLVDAQAPALASTVRRLASVAGSPDRLLTELSLIRLLVAGYRRIDEVPADLAATIRSRIGFPVATDDVLAGPRVRDRWAVVALSETYDERLTVRRCWLRGTATDRPALILTFAAPGQSVPADLVLGTAIEADLCFYPGAVPLRALVAVRHCGLGPCPAPPGAVAVAAALDSYAGALAAEPWLDRWPVLLAGVTPVTDGGGRWHLRDEAGDAVPVEPALGPPWRLVATAGGGPVTVAGEWSSAGLRPLTAWTDGRAVAL